MGDDRSVRGQDSRTPLIWGLAAPKSLLPFLGRSNLPSVRPDSKWEQIKNDGKASVGHVSTGDWRQVWA